MSTQTYPHRQSINGNIFFSRTSWYVVYVFCQYHEKINGPIPMVLQPLNFTAILLFLWPCAGPFLLHTWCAILLPKSSIYFCEKLALMINRYEIRWFSTFSCVCYFSPVSFHFFTQMFFMDWKVMISLPGCDSSAHGCILCVFKTKI